MQVTVKFKILPTKEQERYLKETLNEYITTVYYNPEYGLGFNTPYVVNVDVKFQNRKKL